MIELATILTLASMVVFTAGMPGPEVFYIVSNSLHGELKRGFFAWLGIAVATLIYVVATAFGLSFLFMAVPVLYDVIKFCGVIYLAYLGVNFLIGSFQKSKDSKIEKHKKKPLNKIFIDGFFITILNPKTILFFTALLPQFLDADKGSTSLQLLLLGLAATCVGQTIYVLYVLVFVCIGKKLKEKAKKVKDYRSLKFVSGIIYLLFSIGLLSWNR